MVIFGHFGLFCGPKDPWDVSMNWYKKNNSTIEIVDPKNLDFVTKMKFLGQLLAKLAHGPPF